MRGVICSTRLSLSLSHDIFSFNIIRLALRRSSHSEWVLVKDRRNAWGLRALLIIREAPLDCGPKAESEPNYSPGDWCVCTNYMQSVWEKLRDAHAHTYHFLPLPIQCCRAKSHHWLSFRGEWTKICECACIVKSKLWCWWGDDL